MSTNLGQEPGQGTGKAKSERAKGGWSESMSDYMFMLESHMTAAQMVAFHKVQEAATEAKLSLYLTGAALRDMLSGFPIQELDFTVEGNAIALAKAIAKNGDAELGVTDTRRNQAELQCPRQVPGRQGLARKAKDPKPGTKL